MLILECSQGCYGRTDGSITISLRKMVIILSGMDNITDIDDQESTDTTKSKIGHLYWTLIPIRNRST